MELDLVLAAKQILDAVQGGQWALVAALALMLVVFGLRKFGAAKIPFLATDAGGAVLVLAMAISGAAANALAAGQALSVNLALAALKVGFLAAGGWTVLKKALIPLWEWLRAKLGLQAAA